MCFQKIVAENIFMDIKYIFVPYDRRFDVDIFLKRVFDANIFCAEGEKKRIFNVISFPNLRVIFSYKSIDEKG